MGKGSEETEEWSSSQAPESLMLRREAGETQSPEGRTPLNENQNLLSNYSMKLILTKASCERIHVDNVMLQAEGQRSTLLSDSVQPPTGGG